MANDISYDEALEHNEMLERIEAASPPKITHQDERRVLTHILVKKDTFHRLIEECNQRGVHLQSFAGFMLDSVMATWTPPDEDETDDVKYIGWKEFQFRQLVALYEVAYRLMAEYKRAPTDRLAEILNDVTERMGIDFDRLRERVDNDPYWQIADATRADNEGRFAQCRKSLIAKAANRDDVASLDILDAMKHEGFTEQMTRKALHQLGFASYKHGNHYRWRRSPISRLSSSQVREL